MGARPPTISTGVRYGLRPRGGVGGGRRQRSSQVASIIAGFAYITSLLFNHLAGLEGSAALLLPGLVLCAFSVYGFLRQGDELVTPTAVASFALFVFGGLSAVIIGAGLYPPRSGVSDGGLLYAVSLCFILQLFIVLLCRKGEAEPLVRNPPDSMIAMPKRGRWMWLSISLLVIAMAAHAQPGVAMGIAQLSLVFAAVTAFSSAPIPLRLSAAVILVVGLFLVSEFIFSGFGRLSLAAIVVSVVAVASLHYRKRFVKWIVVVATIPAIMYLSAQRLAFLAAERGVDPQSHEGIGSVVGPLVSSAAIIDAVQVGSISPALGYTVLAALVVWIPRDLWEGKPNGFGYDMVPITQPQLAGVAGYSDAALITGEAVWNFGVYFAPVFLLAVVLGLGYLDGLFQAELRRGDTARRSLGLVMWCVVAASLLNLVWGGFFTLASRLLLPLTFVLIMLAFAGGRGVRGR